MTLASEIYASLVDLADTLTEDFDVVDLSDRLVRSCLDLLHVSAAGILLDGQQGALQVLASSSDEMRVLELLQLQSNEGPCYEAFRTGEPVTGIDLMRAEARWPRFAPAARAQGMRIVYALPMRLRERTIGALNLFCIDPAGLTAEELSAARTMATMATIGILTHRQARQQELLAEQLQRALDSRIVIEQAKGVVAERTGVQMTEAFDMLRATARGSRRRLVDVATEAARGEVAAVVSHHHRGTSTADAGSVDGTNTSRVADST